MFESSLYGGVLTILLKQPISYGEKCTALDHKLEKSENTMGLVLESIRRYSCVEKSAIYDFMLLQVYLNLIEFSFGFPRETTPSLRPNLHFGARESLVFS